jgi:hypothetical protein
LLPALLLNSFLKTHRIAPTLKHVLQAGLKVSVLVFQLDAAPALLPQVYVLAHQTSNAVPKIHAPPRMERANAFRLVLAPENPTQVIALGHLMCSVALAALLFVIRTVVPPWLQEQNRHILFIRTLVISSAVQGLGLSTHMAIVALVMVI